ncbi:MAG TPA: sulfatase-like hydrolase/transferase, partial [Spirochaetia bacterium]|nr:sulfatase-like hydrolase/transferase [Spirochaetia bacterium]
MKKRPNIVVFLTDQQRWDTTGVHGNPLGLTPNFDRIAAEGTHFTNAFTCQPVCAPARSSIQTGRYATQTKVFRNGIAMDTELPTLASVFRAAGYATGYIGKWHLADENPVPPEKRGGYEQWLASNLLEFTSLPYETTLFDNSGSPVKLPGHRIDALTDASIRFLSERADQPEKPFLLFVSHLEPHHQNQHDNYPAPDGYAERYRDPWMPADLRALGGTAAQHLSGYYGMVKKLDEAFGRTMDALKSLSLLEDTIVWYTADHGCHFKTRNNEYKRSCHEASIHIPSAA